MIGIHYTFCGHYWITLICRSHKQANRKHFSEVIHNNCLDSRPHHSTGAPLLPQNNIKYLFLQLCVSWLFNIKYQITPKQTATNTAFHTCKMTSVPNSQAILSSVPFEAICWICMLEFYDRKQYMQHSKVHKVEFNELRNKDEGDKEGGGGGAWKSGRGCVFDTFHPSWWMVYGITREEVKGLGRSLMEVRD